MFLVGKCRRIKKPLVDSVSLAFTKAGLQLCFRKLFGFCGLNNLDDLSAINEDFLAQLEGMVRANDIQESADFTSRFDQIEYLGRMYTNAQLKNFKFSLLDRKKLLVELPRTVDQVREEEKAKLMSYPNSLLEPMKQNSQGTQGTKRDFDNHEDSSVSTNKFQLIFLEFFFISTLF